MNLQIHMFSVQFFISEANSVVFQVKSFEPIFLENTTETDALYCKRSLIPKEFISKLNIELIIAQWLNRV